MTLQEEIRQNLYQKIKETGDGSLWQMLVSFSDGTFGLRTGYLDIALNKYPVPSTKDLDRLYNRDLDGMSFDELVYEWAELSIANQLYKELQAYDNLKCIVICREKGAYLWDEWYELRRQAIKNKEEELQGSDAQCQAITPKVVGQSST